jgi:hypothetical protein
MLAIIFPTSHDHQKPPLGRLLRLQTALPLHSHHHRHTISSEAASERVQHAHQPSTSSVPLQQSSEKKSMRIMKSLQ